MRYDIEWFPAGPEMFTHFCRDCLGTSETHGYSFEDARTQMVDYFKGKLETLENMTEQEFRAHGRI